MPLLCQTNSAKNSIDSTLDQLIVADHTYVQKLNLSGLSGNLASTNASTYLSSQRECYYYNTGWNGMTIYDVSVTINGFYFKFAGSYAAKDGLYEYNYKGHNCADGSSGTVSTNLLPLQKSASALYYSPWSDPTNLSYLVIDSNQKDNDFSAEFSPDGRTIFLKYSICEENSGYTIIVFLIS